MSTNMQGKKYYVFAGDTYQPLGGWDDFVGGYDDPKLAQDAAKEALAARGGKESAWAHVIDTSISLPVWTSQAAQA